MEPLRFVPGKWSAGSIEALIRQSSGMPAGERIAFLSGKFLGTPYQEATLIGDEFTPEVLVINLEGVDCFTFIDYIEAMRLSDSFSDFAVKLKKVRYRSGEPAFTGRNHFFTDWAQFNSDFVGDITADVGGEDTVWTGKRLNRKEDGTALLPGIPAVERRFGYIPSAAADRAMLTRLKTGDYIGIYSSLPGLDVSHVGIVINRDEEASLRHASSRYRKVVDEDLAAYLATGPGLVVLRPKERK